MLIEVEATLLQLTEQAKELYDSPRDISGTSRYCGSWQLLVVFVPVQTIIANLLFIQFNNILMCLSHKWP